jgi:hypothetical protein
MMLPKLKAMLCLPGDSELLTSLEACISNLLFHEKDRDVSVQLQLTIQALAAIEIQGEVVRSKSRGPFVYQDTTLIYVAHYMA